MTTPTLNVNGTSFDALIEQALTAERAVSAAIDAVIQAAPHGRDYPRLLSWRAAREEHEARLARLRSVREELASVAQALFDQHDARRRR